MQIISANITGSLVLNGVDVTDELVSSSIVSGSFTEKIDNLQTSTGSLNSFTSSISGSVDSLSGRVLTIENSYVTTGSNLFVGTQTHSGSIIPAVDNLYDLGSVTHQWRDVFISSGSLYIDGSKVLSSTTQELIITTDNGQSIKILEGTTDSIVLQTADGAIELKSSADGDILLDPTNGKIMLKGPVEILNGSKIQSSVGGSPVVFANDIVVSGSIDLTGTIEGIDLTSFSSSINTRVSNLETSNSNLVSFTGTTNSRLTAIETSTASLNTFSSSINTFSNNVNSALEFTGSNVTIKGDLLVKGTTTTVNSTTVSIGDNIIELNGSSATNGGLLVKDVTIPNTVSGSLLWDSTNDRWIAGQLGLEEPIVLNNTFTGYTSTTNGRLTSLETSTGSLNSFTSSINTTIKNRLNAENVVSGSSQISYTGLSNIPGGIVSGSIQVDLTSTTNYTTGIKTRLNAEGVISGSAQVVAALPAGTVSGSAQISFSGISGVPSGLVSGSAQLTSTFVQKVGDTMTGLLSVGYSRTDEPFVQSHFYNTSTTAGTQYGGVLVSGINQAHLRFLVGTNTWGGAGAKQWQIRVGNGNGSDDMRVYSWTYGADVMTYNSNGSVSVASTLSSVGLTNTGAYSGSSGSFSHNLGNPVNTTELFVHNGSNTPVPFRMTKAGYSGVGGSYGILQLYMNDNTIGNGANLYFCANNSSGTLTEYGGIGMQIKSNTAGSATARLYFYRQERAINGTFDSNGDLYTVGNIYVAGNGTTTGTQVVYNSGTWSINVSGNAASVTNGVYTTSNNTMTGGNKIVIQNSQDGGSGRGIFMWNSSDPNWGIYMAQSGAGKALNDGTAPAGIDGRSEHAIRFRVANSTGQIGFLWENSDNTALMQLQPNTGNLYTRGQIYAGNSTSNLVLHTGNYTSYAMQGAGYSANQNLNTSNTPTFAGVDLTGRLYLNGGSYEGSILFGSNTTWRCGIRQHDDADAELRIWTVNNNGMIFLANGYNGEPADIARPTDGLVVGPGNNVGIGNFSSVDPAYKLEVKGTGYFSSNLTIGGTFTENSSIRYKKDIETLSYGLDKIIQMRGVSYIKKQTEQKEIGVIAEEIAEILPELVIYDTEGNPDSVSYGRITAVLIEAIKELKKEINELKNNG